jgi:hypothetical protein
MLRNSVNSQVPLSTLYFVNNVKSISTHNSEMVLIQLLTHCLVQCDQKKANGGNIGCWMMIKEGKQKARCNDRTRQMEATYNDQRR